MPTIAQLMAREILDSRGRPTLSVRCTLRSGAVATVSIPSGASTGSAEALELRDGDPKRYRGLGCRHAVANVNDTIQKMSKGMPYQDQAVFDLVLLSLDGTPNKAKLGANALLGASLAFARAHAVELDIPFYQHLADIMHLPLRTLPQLTVNLFSGGKHAGGQVPIQDVLVVPVAAKTIDESLSMVYAVYQAAADLTRRKYGTRSLTADEGGLAPPFPDAETMLADAVEAIKMAEYVPGEEVALAVDVASSHFYQAGRYHLGKTPLDSLGMIDQLVDWVERYPIISIEDGLAEEDWAHWPDLRQRLAGRALTLGDDFLCTNPNRIRRAIETQAANALLLKVNQIGTLSEAASAAMLARSAGWHITVSARSGETEDNWLADLAVGWAGNQIKVGSITQSERLAKYNRLLEIAAETKLPIGEGMRG